MRKRLRTLTAEERAVLYPEPNDHTLNGDAHDERIELTCLLAYKHATWIPEMRIADLSCGDATIPRVLRRDGDTLILGDFAPGYEFEGPMESTIVQIKYAELFICTETLEHVDDPYWVLAAIRQKADQLVLSTPIDNWDDPNIEHLWSWDREGVEDLLTRAGWTVHGFDRTVKPAAYTWGVWVCA